MTNTQRMNNYDMSTQKNPNLHVCSTDEIKPKRIKADESESDIHSKDKGESKKFIVNACYLDERKSKSAHISVNKSRIKYAMDETKDEEPLVTDNSVINALRYFKLFQCDKTFLTNCDATYEQACMENSQKKWDTVVLRYGRVCM